MPYDPNPRACEPAFDDPAPSPAPASTPTSAPTPVPSALASAASAASAMPTTPGVPATPSALDLLHAFRRCAHLQGATKGGRPHGQGQGRILACLLREGPLTQRNLAERLERTPATLSQQLDAMEAAGLVVRRACEADRRTLVVSLTPEGQRAARAAIDERRRVAEELFGDLDEADRRDLLRLLEGRLARWRDAAERPGEPQRAPFGDSALPDAVAPQDPAEPRDGGR